MLFVVLARRPVVVRDVGATAWIFVHARTRRLFSSLSAMSGLTRYSA